MTAAAAAPDRFSMLDRLCSGVRGYVLLFLLTLITAAPGVFTMPALDRDESRFAQASKQMLETGDYITIRYQDGQRNKKPAGIHWLQAGTTALFSSVEAREIWSYRLPSFIGGALATAILFWAGIPFIGRRAAFLGAALFGTGLLLTSEAHISKTDGVLVAITTLGVGALIHLRERYVQANGPPVRGTDKRLVMLFWFAMGFGFLIKGPVTPMVAGFMVLVLLAWERRTDWMKPLAWWPGPLLFVAMVLPWFLAIQFATDGEFVKGAVGKDLRDKLVTASEGHGGLPGYHLLHLATHFFPATLFLIPGVVSVVKRFREPGSLSFGRNRRPARAYRMGGADMAPVRVSAHQAQPLHPAGLSGTGAHLRLRAFADDRGSEAARQPRHFAVSLCVGRAGHRDDCLSAGRRTWHGRGCRRFQNRFGRSRQGCMGLCRCAALAVGDCGAFGQRRCVGQSGAAFANRIDAGPGN